MSRISGGLATLAAQRIDGSCCRELSCESPVRKAPSPQTTRRRRLTHNRAQLGPLGTALVSSGKLVRSASVYRRHTSELILKRWARGSDTCKHVHRGWDGIRERDPKIKGSAPWPRGL